MASIPATFTAVQALKCVAHERMPHIKSAHLAEALAAALGFRTQAALRAHLQDAAQALAPMSLRDAFFHTRLRELGYEGPYDSLEGLAPAPATAPVRFDATRSEMLQMVEVAKAYEAAIAPHEVHRMTVLMDLEACHSNGCPLDLAGLLAARTVDLVHDVAGISRYLNRETGKLEQGFCPRYARR
jgi:hypothetical protein